MKRIPKFVALVAILFGLTASAAFAQFAGTENFNTALGSNWSGVQSANTPYGTVNVTLGLNPGPTHLSFTGDITGTATPSEPAAPWRWISWNAGNGSKTQDWSVTLDVYNAFSSSTNGQYVAVGLRILNWNNPNQSVDIYYDQMRFSDFSNNIVRSELDQSAMIGSGPQGPISQNNGTLQISFNSITSVITTSYNFGTDKTLASYGVASSGGSSGNSTWDLTGSNPFQAQIMFRSENQTISTMTLAEGTVYADNFAVTAVPEPGTYAALFGVAALGFVAWRRRRQA